MRLARKRYGRNSFIHSLSSLVHLHTLLCQMCATPLGAMMALIRGTATNTTPITRWLMRMANTASGPTAWASGGTNTKQPETISQMQQITVMP